MLELQKDLCSNAQRKAGLLINKAASLGMDITGYGCAGENSGNGNVYLWLEDYPFSLYIDLSGDDKINACWSNLMDGEEQFIFDISNNTLDELVQWANELEVIAEHEEV